MCFRSVFAHAESRLEVKPGTVSKGKYGYFKASDFTDAEYANFKLTQWNTLRVQVSKRTAVVLLNDHFVGTFNFYRNRFPFGAFLINNKHEAKVQMKNFKAKVLTDFHHEVFRDKSFVFSGNWNHQHQERRKDFWTHTLRTKSGKGKGQFNKGHIDTPINDSCALDTVAIARPNFAYWELEEPNSVGYEISAEIYLRCCFTTRFGFVLNYKDNRNFEVVSINANGLKPFSFIYTIFNANENGKMSLSSPIQWRYRKFLYVYNYNKWLKLKAQVDKANNEIQFFLEGKILGKAKAKSPYTAFAGFAVYDKDHGNLDMRGLTVKALNRYQLYEPQRKLFLCPLTFFMASLFRLRSRGESSSFANTNVSCGSYFVGRVHSHLSRPIRSDEI